MSPLLPAKRFSHSLAFIVAALLGITCRHGKSSDPAHDRSPNTSTPSTSPTSEPETSAAPEAASTNPQILFTGDPPLPNPNPRTPQPPNPATPTQRYTVAIIGDSLTDYKSHGGKFIRYLEERCPKSRFDNFGKGADMINQMRRRFQVQILAPRAPQYTHVVVFGGVNDLYSDLTAHRTNDKIRADLTQMYTWAREAGASVVAINVAPWGGFSRYFNERRGNNTLELNAWIAEQEGSAVDAVIDAHTLLRCGHPHELCPEYAAPYKDGLHFGPKGHEVLGEALWKEVFTACE